MLPGPRHRGLTTIRTLLIWSLNWELRRVHGVYGTPGKAYSNLAPGQHTFYRVGQHTFTKRMTPVSAGLTQSQASQTRETMSQRTHADLVSLIWLKHFILSRSKTSV